MKALVASGAIVFVACAPVHGNDGGTDGGTDTGADAYVDLSTPYSCAGVLTCNPNEYCIHTCCATACAGSSGGLCPFGTHIDASCPDGCRNDSCTPPPIRCGSNTDPCFGVSRTGRDVFCVCG